MDTKTPKTYEYTKLGKEILDLVNEQINNKTKELQQEIKELKEAISALDEMAECIQDNTHRIIGLESRLSTQEDNITSLERWAAGKFDRQEDKIRELYDRDKALELLIHGQDEVIESLHERIDRLEEDRKRHFEITHQWGIGEDVANLQERVAALEKGANKFGARLCNLEEPPPQDSRREVIKRAREIAENQKRLYPQAQTHTLWDSEFGVILKALTLAEQSIKGE